MMAILDHASPILSGGSPHLVPQSRNRRHRHPDLTERRPGLEAVCSEQPTQGRG